MWIGLVRSRVCVCVREYVREWGGSDWLNNGQPAIERVWGVREMRRLLVLLLGGWVSGKKDQLTDTLTDCGKGDYWFKWHADGGGRSCLLLLPQLVRKEGIYHTDTFYFHPMSSVKYNVEVNYHGCFKMVLIFPTYNLPQTSTLSRTLNQSCFSRTFWVCLIYTPPI